MDHLVLEDVQALDPGGSADFHLRVSPNHGHEDHQLHGRDHDLRLFEGSHLVHKSLVCFVDPSGCVVVDVLPGVPCIGFDFG